MSPVPWQKSHLDLHSSQASTFGVTEKCCCRYTCRHIVVRSHHSCTCMQLSQSSGVTQGRRESCTTYLLHSPYSVISFVLVITFPRVALSLLHFHSVVHCDAQTSRSVTSSTTCLLNVVKQAVSSIPVNYQADIWHVQSQTKRYSGAHNTHGSCTSRSHSTSAVTFAPSQQARVTTVAPEANVCRTASLSATAL